MTSDASIPSKLPATAVPMVRTNGGGTQSQGDGAAGNQSFSDIMDDISPAADSATAARDASQQAISARSAAGSSIFESLVSVLLNGGASAGQTDTSADANGVEGAKEDTAKEADAEGESRAQSGDDTTASNTPSTTKGAVDMLAASLAAGTGKSPIAEQKAAEEPSSSRQHRFTSFQHAALPENAAADSMAQDVVVLRKETHFAPVNTMANHAQTLADKAGINTQMAQPVPADELAKAAQAADAQVAESARPEGEVTVSASANADDGVATSSGQQDSPLMRIAGQLLGQARDIESSMSRAIAGSGAAQQTSDPQAIQHGPVKILRIQLHPNELGVVTARMRLIGDVLELRLSAEQVQAAELLRRDQDSLLDLFRNSGYKLEIASIEVARTASSSAQANQPSNNSSQAGEFNLSGQPSAEGQAEGQAGSDTRQQSARQNDTATDTDAIPDHAVPNRDPDSLYV